MTDNQTQIAPAGTPAGAEGSNMNLEKARGKLKEILIVVLITALITESVILGYLIYQKKNQPEYLLTMNKEIWSMLDKDQRKELIRSMYEYSKRLNPEWDSRVMYVYDHDGRYNIFFIPGQVESMPAPRIQKKWAPDT